MPSVSLRTIYYLPGYGGQLWTGLGQGLMDRGFDVTGRETRGDFRNLPFDEQLQTVMRDLQEHFWHEQAQLPAFVGRVLLLSPIVGEFTNEQAMTSFSPPRPDRLKQLAQAGQFKTPLNCEIHVGEEDWQSIPANVQVFGQMTGIPITVVPCGGHDLGKEYVGPLLDRWLVRG